MSRRPFMSKAHDITALAARAAVGAVLIAHGLPKATDPGGTAAGFEAMGVPVPEAAALVGAVIEVGFGAALVVGLLLPVTGVVLAAMMGSALAFAHVGDPLVGGYELPMVLGLAALALGFSGGRLALDSLLPLPWSERSSRKQETPAAERETVTA
ncbi:membrane protein [Nocardiopsis kunsanensis]|uniref:Membrane protein n=1 Tax=Nocardiopsis kunsanensis TaxID=141693 RepID=A0A919CGZ8_9ACTN|nr:DoxX family protein [Nocardiopsis kunsanensis]GHD24520.1 membrane protein [Nocardiopsis kunsanensis]